jgi:hypothetical protein
MRDMVVTTADTPSSIPAPEHKETRRLDRGTPDATVRVSLTGACERDWRWRSLVAFDTDCWQLGCDSSFPLDRPTWRWSLPSSPIEARREERLLRLDMFFGDDSCIEFLSEDDALVVAVDGSSWCFANPSLFCAKSSVLLLDLLARLDVVCTEPGLAKVGAGDLEVTLLLRGIEALKGLSIKKSRVVY